MRRIRLVSLAVAIGAGGLLGAACSNDDGGADDSTADDDVPVASVTVPPSRLTPFCQRMIDLDVAIADADVDEPVGDLITEAYREALPDAPPEIAVEFAAVLDELETGVPATLPPGSVVLPPITVPPTITISPPASAPDLSEPTTPTTPPSSTSATENAAPTSTFAPPEEGETFLEEGYLPDETPAQRVNDYIDASCRNTLNNPGPPATQPGGVPAPTTVDEG